MKNVFALCLALLSLPASAQMWENYAMQAGVWSMQPPETAEKAALKFHLPFESGESQLGGDDITISS